MVRLTFAEALMTLFSVACALGAVRAQEPTGKSMGPADRQVISEEGGYSCVLPAGWSLVNADTTAGSVRLQHDESGAYFWVQPKTRRGTLDEELKAFKMALPFVGGAWHLESEGYRKIGGKRAGEVVSTRTYPGESPLVLHSYVLVHKGHAYMMEFGVPKAQAEELDADRLALLETFEWLQQPRGKKR